MNGPNMRDEKTPDADAAYWLPETIRDERNVVRLDFLDGHPIEHPTVNERTK